MHLICWFIQKQYLHDKMGQMPLIQVGSIALSTTVRHVWPQDQLNSWVGLCFFMMIQAAMHAYAAASNAAHACVLEQVQQANGNGMGQRCTWRAWVRGMTAGRAAFLWAGWQPRARWRSVRAVLYCTPSSPACTPCCCHPSSSVHSYEQ